MRSLITSVAILLLIVIFCVFVTFSVLRGVGEMEGVLTILEKHQPSEVTGTLESLEVIFEKKHFLFSISLPMDDVDALKSALIYLRGAVETDDKAAYDNALCALRFALYRLRDAASPSPETIL